MIGCSGRCELSGRHALVLGICLLFAAVDVHAQQCTRTVKADVVAIDQAYFINRLGTARPGGLLFALRSDVESTDAANSALQPGRVQLKSYKRPRPFVLRANVGDCVDIKFQNLLANNPTDPVQPMTRNVSLHITGMSLRESIASDGMWVGQNPPGATGMSGDVAPGASITYKLYASAEGSFLIYSQPGDFNNFGTQQLTMGLFGALNVEPAGAEWYRSQVTQSDLAMATNGSFPDGHPKINYDAVYPPGNPRAGKPILRMLDADNNVAHSDLTAVITGPHHGLFPGDGGNNPILPNRNWPFREVTVHYHESQDVVQAWAYFYPQNSAVTRRREPSVHGVAQTPDEGVLSRRSVERLSLLPRRSRSLPHPARRRGGHARASPSRASVAAFGHGPGQQLSRQPVDRAGCVVHARAGVRRQRQSQPHRRRLDLPLPLLSALRVRHVGALPRARRLRSGHAARRRAARRIRRARASRSRDQDRHADSRDRSAAEHADGAAAVEGRDRRRKGEARRRRVPRLSVLHPRHPRTSRAASAAGLRRRSENERGVRRRSAAPSDHGRGRLQRTAHAHRLEQRPVEHHRLPTAGRRHAIGEAGDVVLRTAPASELHAKRRGAAVQGERTAARSATRRAVRRSGGRRRKRSGDRGTALPRCRFTGRCRLQQGGMALSAAAHDGALAGRERLRHEQASAGAAVLPRRGERRH